jgi:transcriptional regulator with XRE-family HTH domain
MDNPALYKVLGQRIADARRNYASQTGTDLSQSGLARMIGVTRGSVANIELGNQRPPLHVLWAIGQALGIEPRLLIPHSAELSESLLGSTKEAEAFEPRVKRVIEELPEARAWLAATRSQVGPAKDLTARGRKR